MAYYFGSLAAVYFEIQYIIIYIISQEISISNINTMNKIGSITLNQNRSMKKILLSFFMFVATVSIAIGQNANDWFITVWKTSGTSIKFPAYQVNNGYYTLKCVQLADDGTEIAATMHTYTPNTDGYEIPVGLPAGKKYRVYAYGDGLKQIYHNYWQSRNDIILVEQWGTTKWKSFNNAFVTCQNLDVTATDKPDLSQCTDLTNAFYYCTSLVNANGSIAQWETQTITNMQQMFYGDTLFNHSLAAYKITANNWYMQSIAGQSGISCENFSATLDSWKTQAVALDRKNINIGEFPKHKSYNEVGREAIKVLKTLNWTFPTDIAFAAGCIKETNWFKTIWKPTGTSIKFPAMATGSNYIIKYEPINAAGDPIGEMKTIDPAADGQTISGLTAGQRYRIYAFGSGFKRISFETYPQNKDEILRIEQWGTTPWSTFLNAFKDCSNLNVTTASIDKPNLFALRSLSGMFYGCKSLVYDNIYSGNYIYNWAVDSVTDMSNMFRGASSFNQHLYNWNAEKVTNMDGMFRDASSFNLPIGYFRIKAVTSMKGMFVGSAMNCENISSTLEQWKAKAVANNIKNVDLTGFIANPQSYNQKGKNAIDSLTLPAFGWTITGGNFAPDCVSDAAWFVTDWKPRNGSISFPARLIGSQPADKKPFSIKYIELDASGNPTGTMQTPYVNNAFDGAWISFQGFAAGKRYRVYAYGGTFQKIDFKTYAWYKDDIINVVQWGSTQWKSLDSAFYQCTNLDVTATDKPDLSAGPSLQYMFQECKNLKYANGVINSWNMQNVYSVNSMFRGDSAFNQPLGGWKLSRIGDMQYLFYDSGISCENVSTTLAQWKQQAENNISRNNISMQYFINTDQTYNETGRDAIEYLSAAPNSWYFYNSGTFAPNCDLDSYWFVTTWSTDGTTQIKFPATGTSSDYAIKYVEIDDDGNEIGQMKTVAPATDNQVINSLKYNKKYRLYAYGEGLKRIYFYNAGSNNQILKIEKWGKAKWNSFNYAFHQCNNLDITATDKPDLSDVTDMSYMFFECKKLKNENGSINSWNTDKVTNMSYTFGGTNAFNQPLNGWNTSKVTTMSYMFKDATAFNQPLSSWNTSKVTTMYAMFEGATSFDRSLASFRLDTISDMRNILKGSGISCENASASLVGWKTQAQGNNKIKNVDFTNFLAADQSYNQDGRDAIEYLKTAPRSWSISGGKFTEDCINDAKWFKTLWKASATSITFPAVGSGYILRYVPVDAAGNPAGAVQTIDPAAAGQVISGLTVGQRYRILAYGGSFTQLSFDTYQQSRSDLLRVEQWGSTQWTSFANAFKMCVNMNVTSSDKPDLSALTDLSGMFDGCVSLTNNNDIKNWDTKNVTNMSNMFFGATSFNQNLSNWNTSKVTNMDHMFQGATSFNQPVGSFRINALTSAQNIFMGSGMSCENISSTLDDWKTKAAADNITNVDLSSFIDGSSKYYNQTGQTAINDLTTNRSWTITGGTFAADCQSPNSWFKTIWQPSGNNIRFPASNTSAAKYTLKYEPVNASGAPIGPMVTVSTSAGDGQYVAGLTPGQRYRFYAYGEGLKSINFYSYSTNKDEILLVEQWGTAKWTSFYCAFYQCANLNVTATDIPDLSGVTDMSYMFYECKKLIYNSSNINSWNTENVTNKSYMFYGARLFNQPIGGMKLKTGVNMNYILQGSGIDCSNLSTTLDSWQAQAESNGDLKNIALTQFVADTQSYNEFGNAAIQYLKAAPRSWTITGGITMPGCNQDGAWFKTVWKVPTNGKIQFPAYNGNSFKMKYVRLDGSGNEEPSTMTPINGYDGVTISSLTPGRLYRIYAFGAGFKYFNINQYSTNKNDLIKVEQWGSTKWSSFEYAFYNAANLDVTATDVPDLSEVTNMQYMFYGCTSLKFNSSINSWDASNVTTMYQMFNGDTAFNQPIGGMKIKASVNMYNILYNTGLSCQNLSATLAGWKAQAEGNSELKNVSLAGFANLDQTYNETGLDAIEYLRAAPRSWSISGGTFAAGCNLDSYWFKTVWKAPTNGQIRFPAYGSSSYTLKWVELDGSGNELPLTMKKQAPAGDGYTVSGLTAGKNYRFYAYGENLKSINAYQYNYNNNSDNILKVEQWGKAKWTSFQYAFYNCKNLDVTATDVPDLSETTNMEQMFYGCTSLKFNSSINSWNPENVTNMNQMFNGATKFNQPIGGWKLKQSVYMNTILSNTAISCQNLSATLVAWKAQADTNANLKNVNLGSFINNYQYYNENGRAAVDSLKKAPRSWSISGGKTVTGCDIEKAYFVTDWKAPTSGKIYFPAYNSSGYKLKWVMLDGSGNPTGTPDSIINAGDNQQISGLTAGKEYRLYAFGGNFNRINFSYNSSSRNDILRVKQWGTAQWSSFEYAFYYCPNLDVVATDAPDMSAVTNMNYMFRGCTSLIFNNSINSWDARNVTDMQYMFQNASAFNHTIGGMKLKASVNMNYILQGTAIDCDSLSATIAGWKAQAQNDTNLRSVNLNNFVDDNRYYDQNARQNVYYLQSAPRSWQFNHINRTLINCSDMEKAWFITEWKASGSTIYFPAYGANNYTIKYVEIDNTGAVIGTWQTISNASDNQQIPVTAGKRYRIKAFGGSFRQIHFYYYSGSRSDIQAVTQWGTTDWRSFVYAFYNCPNLDVTATDKPDLLDVKDMRYAFQDCPALVNSNGSMRGWDTRNVTYMEYMFKGATSFNSPLDGWNTEKVQSMYYMFQGATSFNQPLGKWNTKNVSNMNYMFDGATAFAQSLAGFELKASANLQYILQNTAIDCDSISATLIAWKTQAQNDTNLRNVYLYNFIGSDKYYNPAGRQAMQYLKTAPRSWYFSDYNRTLPVCNDTSSAWFVTEWKASNNYIYFPAYSTGNDYTIKYVEIDAFGGNEVPGTTHWIHNAGTNHQISSYITAGKLYRISVFGGTFRQIYFGSYYNSKDDIYRVTQWGSTDWRNFDGAFTGCSNLDVTATDKPYLEDVQYMNNMFYGCKSLKNTNGSINTWDVSNVVQMQQMFYGDSLFNQPLNNWNTEKVTSMNSMFYNAASFNQPLSWNTSKVTDMSNMFWGAKAFNQPLSFNTSSVVYMNNMFYNAVSFNSPLNFTNTSKVQYMGGMFYNDSAFNQPVNFNTSEVTDMGNMFGNAASFNQPVNFTNTSKVRSMSSMFYGAKVFNQPLYFNILSVQDMSSMFQGAKKFNSPLNFTYSYPSKLKSTAQMFYEASDFNQPINFNTDSVVNMINMFCNDTMFNQPVNFNTSQVRAMSGMFQNAKAFNQPINFDTRLVRNMQNMFQGAKSFNYPLGHLRLDSINNRDNHYYHYWWWWGGYGMSGMLSGSGMNCQNMTSTLVGWKNFALANAIDSVQAQWMMGNGQFYDDNGKQAIDLLRDSLKWDISGGTYAPDCTPLYKWFTTLWKPAGTSIQLPTIGTNYAVKYVELDASGNEKSATMQTIFPASSGQTITGLTAGTKYRVYVYKATGTFDQVSFATYPANKDEILRVERWGAIVWSSFEKAFKDCSKLNVRITNTGMPDEKRAPDLSAVTSLESMFEGCSSMDSAQYSTYLYDWNTEHVTTMKNMFKGTIKLKELYTGQWIIKNVTDLSGMFDGSGINCEYFSWTMVNWKHQADSLSINGVNAAGIIGSRQYYNEQGRDSMAYLVASRGWTISGGRFAPGCIPPEYYVSEWDMSKPAKDARTDAATTLATNIWGTNFRIEWANLNPPYDRGSATVTATTAPYTITGLTAGARYRVVAYPDTTIVGSTLARLSTRDGANIVTDLQRLRLVSQWGTNKWKAMAHAFHGTLNINVTAIDSPDLSGLDVPKSLASMFESCESMTYGDSINNWNTSGVTDMSRMFAGTNAFNSPIGKWDVSSVTNMQAMFYESGFNKPLNDWNVENVTDMSSMFEGAQAFDQDLSSWTLKSVTAIADMFKAPLNSGIGCKNYSKTLQGWANNSLTKTGLNFTGQDNRKYNIVGKIARGILTKAVAQGGKGWTISGDSEDTYCGIDYVWTGAVSTDITNNGNWQGGQAPTTSTTLDRTGSAVVFSPTAANDMHIPTQAYTPPGSAPNAIPFYSFGDFVNQSNKKLVVEPNGHLFIAGEVLGSDSANKADKIVVKADNTRPNGSLILGGQPCDKPVYATVEMYSKASKSAVSISWTDNIPGSPTHGQSISSSYKWQYIGIPVEGEVVNAFYGSYLRKYDETLNSTDHFYGKWHKLGADETWQPLVPFAGYEVTSRTPKVYVFKGRLLHCPQELTLTRQAAEVTAYTGTDIHKKYYGLGQNIFGNSYTAALRIGDGRLSDAIGSKPIEKTVYIYNTGSIADWNGGTKTTGDGSFLAVPANIAGSPELSAEYISSMQGFLLKFRNDALTDNTGAPEKITIGLRNGGVEPFGGNQRPQRAPQADPIHGFLKVGLTSRRSVSSISLIEAEGTTDEFDNGWDGMQLNTGRSSSATLFVPSEYGDLQVSTSDNIVGDRFGIVNNGDTTYRLTVIRHRLDNRGDLYLYDVATNRYTLLDADTTVYDFTSEGSGNVDKRFVITDRRNADDPNTAVDEAAEDMSLYGYVDGRHTLVVNNHTAEAGMLTLLDVSGKVVYTSPFGVGFSRHDLSHLPAGVYIARLEASVRRATVKAITMK